MRKRLILGALCAIAMATAASAQDKIITMDGDVIPAYRIDVGGSSIYYSIEDSDDSPVKKIDKDKVVMIKKQDGTVQKLFEQGATSAATPAAAPAATGKTKVTVESLSPAAREANERYLAMINQEITPYIEKDDGKRKEAKDVYMIFGLKDNSVAVNEDISVTAELGYLYKTGKTWDFYKVTYYGRDNAVKFTVKNNTDNTIYLDLGNTFYTMLGTPACYYVPSSTINTSVSSTGSAVNIGAGISLGGASTNSSTSVAYSQRVVAIPPMATRELEPMFMFNLDGSYLGGPTDSKVPGLFMNAYFSSYGSREWVMNLDKDQKLQETQKFSYTAETSPITFSFMVSYSMTEDCAVSKSLTLNYFLKDIVAYKSAGSMSTNQAPRVQLQGSVDSKAILDTRCRIHYEKSSCFVLPGMSVSSDKTGASARESKRAAKAAASRR